MDSYALARAESRIRELEFEIHRLKLETGNLKANVRALESNARLEPSFFRTFFTGFVWSIPFCAFGLLVGQLIGRALKAFLS